MPVGLCQYFGLILQDNNSFLNVVDRNDELIVLGAMTKWLRAPEHGGVWLFLG
jgi:hypothetical protein